MRTVIQLVSWASVCIARRARVANGDASVGTVVVEDTNALLACPYERGGGRDFS